MEEINRQQLNECEREGKQGKRVLKQQDKHNVGVVKNKKNWLENGV